ncbi:hypothetical protein [Methanosphaera sp. BMS]|uniref:hypothetical protein n=1 Tax=Methanosphaera sp. BMS TaxID=1789762 RepID=UPI000DC1D6C0|nr:hypothetical protein [Methanosphaera sp. BMS]AWX32299.1 hypothetical protein AW729_03895 [Methanosphaera sp. BMS]
MKIDFLKEDEENKKNAVYFLHSNSPKLSIEYVISEKINGNFPHLGISVREGIHVMYKTKKHSNWLNVEQYARHSNVHVPMFNYIEKNEEYDLMIYGPILSSLKTLTVRCSDADKLVEYKSDYSMEISVIGGLHSFGIGCTTVGLMFSNIISRRINAKVNHISFNNKNYLKDVFFKLFNSDVRGFIGIIEVDYHYQDDEIVQKYLYETVKLMKSKFEHIICWFSIPEKSIYKKHQIYEILKNEIDNKEIVLIDMSFLYEEPYKDMCTLNDYFINDTGNIMIYKKLIKIIGEY